MTTDTPHDVARRLHRAYLRASQRLIDAAYGGASAEEQEPLEREARAALDAWRSARDALPGPDPRRTTRPTCALGHRNDGPACGPMCVRGTRRFER